MDFEAITNKINYQFRNKLLLKTALTHSSAVLGDSSSSYERLEFLGDALLSFIISEYLFNNPSAYKEGEMTALRSALVKEETLSAAINNLGLYEFVIKGNGLEEIGKTKISCDIFESLTGAIYLDGGIEAAEKFVFDNLEVNNILNKNYIRDYKSDLQIYAQSKHIDLPKYYTVKQNDAFYSEVNLNGKLLGNGTGKTKKEAEKSAARSALSIIEGDKQ